MSHATRNRNLAFDSSGFGPQRSLPNIAGHDADHTQRKSGSRSRRNSSRGQSMMAQSQSVEYRVRSPGGSLWPGPQSGGRASSSGHVRMRGGGALQPLQDSRRRYPALTEVQWGDGRRMGDNSRSLDGGVPADSYRRHTAILESDGTMEGQPWAPPTVSRAPAARLSRSMEVHTPTMEHFAHGAHPRAQQYGGEDVFGNPSGWDMRSDEQHHAELLHQAEMQTRESMLSQDFLHSASVPNMRASMPASWGQEQPQRSGTLRPMGRRRTRGKLNVVETRIQRNPMRTYFDEQVAMTEQMMALQPRNLEQRVMATLNRALHPEVARFYAPRTPEGDLAHQLVDYEVQLDEEGPATTIQAYWRGKKQREKAEKARRAMRFWAHGAVGAAFSALVEWRQRLINLRVGVMRNMRYGALAQCFDRWYAEVECNEAARVLQRLERERRERQKHKGAMRYWAGKSVGKCFHLWQTWIEESRGSTAIQARWRARQERKGYVKSRSALRFWVGKSMGTAFDRWQKFAKKVVNLRLRTLMRWGQMFLAYAFDHWMHTAQAIADRRLQRVGEVLEGVMVTAMQHDPTERYVAGLKARGVTGDAARMGAHYGANQLRHALLHDGANTLGGDADQHGEVGMELPLSEPAEGITTPLQSTDEESKSWFGGKNKKQSTPPRLLPAAHVYMCASEDAAGSFAISVHMLRTMNVDVGGQADVALICTMQLQLNELSLGTAAEEHAEPSFFEAQGVTTVRSVAEEGAADDAQQHNEAMVRNMGFDAKSAKTALEKYGTPVAADAQQVTWRRQAAQGGTISPEQAAADGVFVVRDVHRTRIKCAIALEDSAGDVIGEFYIGLRSLFRQLQDEPAAGAGLPKVVYADAWLLLHAPPPTLHVKIAPLLEMCKVMVDVVGAKELPRGDGDFPDPYCRLDLLLQEPSGGKKDKKAVRGGKSSAARRSFATGHTGDTLSPFWDESFTFCAVPGPEDSAVQGCSVRFTVLDHDMLSADDEICSFSVDIFTLQAGMVHDLWLERDPEDELRASKMVDVVLRQQAMNAFDAIDVDGNGWLDRNEVIEVAKQLLANTDSAETATEHIERTMRSETRAEMNFEDFLEWWCKNEKLEATKLKSGLFGFLSRSRK